MRDVCEASLDSSRGLGMTGEKGVGDNEDNALF